MTRNQTPDGEPLSIRVQGHCPMGCGESLLVDPDGRVVCCANACPRPDAVAVLLADVETKHLVLVGLDGYAIQHPLRERLEGQLFDCTTHAYVSDTVHKYTSRPGQYRVSVGHLDGGGWHGGHWERIGDADV